MSGAVIVVGAGAAGLGAATALARRGAAVEVVDRIPVAGGAAGHASRTVRAHVAAAEGAGVTFTLGATATRWEDGRLLVCAPGAIAWRPASALVFAGGTRPATAAELDLTGDRPAGVLAVQVAKHLLETGAPLWRRAAIVGDGPDAAAAARMIRAAGGTVVAVGHAPTTADRAASAPTVAASAPTPAASAPDPAASAPPAWADRSYPDWRAVAVHGHPRVASLVIARAGETATLACDAVLLAAGPRPVRNVEGAIADDAPGVVYLQDLGAETFEATARLAGERVACA